MKLLTLVLVSALFTNLIHADIDNEGYEEVLVSASLMPISIRNSANSITEADTRTSS